MRLVACYHIATRVLGPATTAWKAGAWWSPDVAMRLGLASPRSRLYRSDCPRRHAFSAVCLFFRCYSSGAIGTMTGFAGTGLGALGGLSGFAAGAAGTDPVTSPVSPERERGRGGCAASLLAGDVTP